MARSNLRFQVANYALLALVLFAGIGCRQGEAPFSAKVRAAQSGRAKTTNLMKGGEAAAPVAEVAEAPIEHADAAQDELALVDDAATQLLRERLSPPKQVLVPPPAPSTEPRPRQLGKVEQLTLPLVKLPEADVPKTPAVLPHERQKTPFTHPALDAPPLAFARDPARPDIPKLILGPRAFVYSTDAKLVPRLERYPREAERPVTVSDDPSASATQKVIVAPLALPAPVLPPPLFLSIPDPYEHARAVELREAPADTDRPAVSHARPLRPVLTPPPLPKP